MDRKLPLETVENVSEAGIRDVKMTNRPYGLVLELNGNDLPLLICYLDNLLAFADESDRWSNLAPKVEEEKVDLVRRVVQDVLLTANVDITFHFPAFSDEGHRVKGPWHLPIPIHRGFAHFLSTPKVVADGDEQ